MFLNRKWPSESIVAVCLYPVIEFAMLTCALLICAPDGSFTVTSIVPAFPRDWPNVGLAGQGRVLGSQIGIRKRLIRVPLN
jgi:hypothetical protein